MIALLAALFAAMACHAVWAGGHGGCAHCGCECACQKVCRLVKEEKKLTVVCWGGKREEFCVPGKSQKRCEHCENLCPEGPDGCEHCGRKTAWSIWSPADCPTLLTRKKLMKKTITKKIPSYKWVVEDLCADCQSNAKSVDPAPGVEVPPKPNVADAIEAPRETPTQPASR